MIKKRCIMVLLITAIPLMTAEVDGLCKVKDNIRPAVWNVYPTSDVTCTNINIKRYEPIRSIIQPRANVTNVNLTLVTGEVHSDTLKNFPATPYLAIFRSNINSFSLKANIGYLTVYASVFPKITSELLEGCKNLESINFHSNDGLQFEDGAFKHLQSLQYLVIINQTIPHLSRSFLEGTKNLEDLTLKLDNIRSIDEDSFLDLPNLKMLFLDSNPIEELNINIKGLKKLQQLSLMSTNLKRLNADLFGSIKTLTSVTLSGLIMRNANATELTTKAPNLKEVNVLLAELQCSNVKSFVGELKEKEIIVNEFVFDADFVKPLVC